jgi:hypothetical protein
VEPSDYGARLRTTQGYRDYSASVPRRSGSRAAMARDGRVRPLTLAAAHAPETLHGSLPGRAQATYQPVLQQIDEVTTWPSTCTARSTRCAEGRRVEQRHPAAMSRAGDVLYWHVPTVGGWRMTRTRLTQGCSA